MEWIQGNIKRLARSIVCVGTMIVLAGCTARNIKRDFSFQAEPDKGIVILSVSHDLKARHGTKAIFYIDGGVSKGSMLFSASREFTDSYGHLAVLALPPGKHVIDGWQIDSGTGLRIFPAGKPRPLEFEVTHGEIAYLGNLHAHITMGKNLFGMTVLADGYPEVRDRSERDIPIFEREYPQFVGKATVKMLPLGPWLEGGEPRKRLDPVIMMPAPKK